MPNINPDVNRETVLWYTTAVLVGLVLGSFGSLITVTIIEHVPQLVAALHGFVAYTTSGVEQFLTSLFFVSISLTLAFGMALVQEEVS